MRIRTLLVALPGAEQFGSDRVALESVRGAIENGWRVVVALAADGPMRRELIEVGADVELVPTFVLRRSLLTVRGALTAPLVLVTAMARAARFIRRVRPDVVLVNTVILPTWILSARLSRAPVVVHAHEAESEAPGYNGWSSRGRCCSAPSC